MNDGPKPPPDVSWIEFDTIGVGVWEALGIVLACVVVIAVSTAVVMVLL